MKRLLLFVVLVCLSAVAMSQPYYSKAGGDLDQLSTWGDQTDGSGASPADFTTAGVTYIITNRATATLGAAWAVSGVGSKVQVGDGVTSVNFTVPATFAFTGTVEVTSTGTLTLNNASIPTFGTLDAASTVVFSAGAIQSIPGGTYGNLTVSTTTFAKSFAGAVTVAGNLTASSTGTGSITMFAGTNNVTGNLSFTATSTGDFFTSAALNIGGNLSVTSGNAGGTFTLGGNLDVNGNVTLAATANASSWFVPGGFQINVAGNWTVTSSSNTPTALLSTASPSTVIFDGTGPQTISKTAGTALTANFYHFQNSNSGGTVTVAISPSVTTTTLAGNFTNDLGATFACAGANPINVAGNWTNNGIFTRGTSTVTINNAAGTVNLSGNMTGTSAFHNLTVTGAGTRDFAANNAEVANVLTISAGTFTAPSTTLSIGSNMVKPVAGTFNANGGTVQFTGSTAQTLPASAITFHNLDIAKTANTLTATTASTVTVNNTLTVASTASLNMSTSQLLGAFTPTMSGNLLTQCTVNPAIPTGQTWGGTVIFNATTLAQVVSAGTYNNLTVSTTSGEKTFTGDVTVSGTLATSSTGAGSITFFGGTTNVGTFTSTLTSTGDVKTAGPMNVTGNFSHSSSLAGGVTQLGGNLDVNGNITLSNSINAANPNTFDPNGFQINAGGNWRVTSTTAAAVTILDPTSNSTVIFDGSGTQQIEKGTGTALTANFRNLQISNTANAVTVLTTTVTPTTVAGNLTIDALANLSKATNTLTVTGNVLINGTLTTSGANTTNVAGDWTNNGTFTCGTGTVVFNGGGSQTLNGTMTGSTGQFYALQFNNGAGTWSFGANSADVTNNMTITAGTVTAPSTTLKVAGNFVNTAGTFNDNGGTVELNGTTVQAIPTTATTFNNLNISNSSATVTANANLTVNGTLTTSASANLNMVTFQLLGTVTPAHSGTLQTQCTVNPPIPVAKTWGGQVTYSGGNMNISQGNYNNLTISGTTGTRAFTAGTTSVAGNFSLSTTTGVTTLAGDLDVNGNITLTETGNTNNILDPAGSNINVGGNWLVSSSGTSTTLLNAASSSLVTFDGTGTQTINRTAGASLVPNFFNFRNSNTSSNPLNIIYNMTISGDVTNDASAILTIGTNTVNMGGNWTNNGTFTANASTVNFNSGVAGKTLTGNMTGSDKFNNLIFNGAGTWTFGSASADVGGNFTITTGTVTAPSTTLKVAGNFVYTAGTFNNNGGTVELNGTIAQAFPTTATTFNNLNVSNTSATVTANATLTVNGTLTTAASANLNMSTFQLLGTVTPAHSGTLQTQCAVNPPIPLAKTWGGLVSYSGGNMNISQGNYNNLTISGTTGSRTFTAGTTSVAGNFSLSTTTGITTLAGDLDVNGNVTLAETGNNNSILNPAGFNINVGGDWTVSSTGTSTALMNVVSTSLVTFDGTGTQTITRTSGSALVPNFFNFRNSNTSSNPLGIVYNMTISGDVTNDASAILTIGTNTVTVGGNWTNNGTFTANASTVNLTSGVAGKTLTGNMTGANKFNNITFNGAGTWTFGANSADVAGNFRITTGTVTAPSTTLKVGGDFIHTAGTFTHNSGTVELNGTGAQAIPTSATTFNILNLNNTGGTISLNAATTVNQDFIIPASNTLSGGSATLTLVGNYTNNGTFTAGAGTVAFTAADAGNTLDGSMTGSNKFNNITFNNAVGTWTFGANSADVGGNFTITTGIVVAPSTTLKVGGNFVHTAGTFTHNSGTVELNGTGAQAIPTTATTFNTLTLNNTGGTITLNAATSVLQDFTIPASNTLACGAQTLNLAGNYENNGTFTANTGTVVFNATSTGKTLTGAMTGANRFFNVNFNSATGGWDCANNSIDVGGVFSVTATAVAGVKAPSTTLKVAGNFVRGAGGTFDANGGTVEFNGTAAQTFPGAAVTFNNVSISNVTNTVTATVATTINGTLTTLGASVLNMSTFQLLGTTDGTGNAGILSTANTTNPTIPTGRTWGGLVRYVGGNQTVAQGAYNNLSLIGTTNTRAFTAGATTVAGTFSVSTTSGIISLAAGGTGALDVNGDFVLAQTGTNTNSIFNPNGNTINVGGNWTVTTSSATTTGLFNAGAASTVILDGTGVQTVSKTAGAALSPNFYGLQVANTSNPVAFSNSTNIANNLQVAASATVSPTTETVQFNPSAAAGTISGSGTILVNRTTATADYSTQYRFSTNTLGSLTVNYSGAGAQNVNSFTYGTLRTSGSGTKTAQGNVTVNNALDVTGVTVLDMGSANRLIAGTAPTYTVNGTLLTSVPTATSSSPIPSGATWNGSGTVEYGVLTGAQTVVSGTYNSLMLDNTSGVNVAGGDISVGGTITLGKLSLGTANLILADGASVSGASASNYVVTGGTGNVRKVFSANGTFSYPVGDATNFTPISINMSGSGYSSAYTEARVNNSKHPANASSTDYLNRFWTVGTSGITAQSYTATATYVGGDISGTEGNIDAATYGGSLPWTMFDPIGSNTLTAPGISGTSIAISGVSNVPPSVSVSPASATICNGGTEPLAATPTGDAPFTYSWSPSTGLSATTGASVNASPVNTGTATATVVYTVTMTDGNGNTATNTTTINVNPQEPITGTLSVCEGSNVTLTPTTPGGNWTSATPAVGTINSVTGVFQGIDQGTTAVTYTLPSACFSTVTMTVNNMPAAIGGTLTVCKNATTALTNAEAGGTWSTSNAAIATVGSASGVVTGVDAGTATITYTLPGNCFVTAEVTVNALPVITGITTICNSTSNTLSATPIGGAWTSSDVVVATVGGGTGVVSGLTAGTANISYTDLNTCVNSIQVTVTPTLANIGGISGICEGLTTTLTHAIAGGTWSSANASLATIDANTGLLTAVSEGLVNITYTLGTGCFKVKSFAVQHQPEPITGNLTMCESSYTVLYSTVGGSGTWTSSDVGVATANVTTGMITSVSQGTATITYRIPTSGCEVTAEVTVNPLPAAIAGGNTFCQGSVENYTSATPGGAWVSSNTGVGTINSATGAATGVSAGVTTISYTLPTGCRVTKSVTVNNMPAAITGTLGICSGGTSALASGTPGGVWSSSTPAVGTISVGGVVTAIGVGNTTINYTMGTGCLRSVEVTVNTTPGANTGTAEVCIGSTTTLANATVGGTWTSSDITKATVGAATGIVTGVATGTSNITYSLAGGGCFAVTEVTVNAAATSITGTAEACVGLTSTLGHATPGGVWSTANPAIATVNAATGEVTAVSAGYVTITYMATPTCGTTISFHSKALPAAITGNLIACVGTSSALANATAEGTWSSSNTGVAVINATTGMMTGVSVGNATITYLLGSGCQITAQATINAAPAAITGPSSVCFDAVTTVNCTPGGGTWSSSNVAAATINSSTGEVTGVAPGTTILTYTHAVSGCLSTRVQTVGATPASITGALTICATSTSTLANATAGGTWSSSNLAVGTVGSATGIVRGISSGTTTITYHQSGGCFVTTEATVNTSITANTGDNNLCVAGSTALANVTGGGTWSSSTIIKATVGSLTGIVTGVASGTAVISYRVTPSCYATSVVTVAASPAAIGGSAYVCIDADITLTHAVPGGTWSSSNPTKGSIDAVTGVLRGIASGSTVVTYVPSNGCFVTKTINIANNPPAISGTMGICVGGSSALTCVIGGSATWSSSNPAVGTIGLTSGMLTGLTSGTTTITYRLNTTGCYSVREATVNPLPAAISGSNTICVGSSTTYTNATGGGTWTSSNSSIANIGSASGIAAAGTAGVATIFYTLSTGCRSTKVITVNTLPAAITGTTNFCVGGVGVLASSTGGGVWTSDNVAASVAGSGTVTATGVGASVISYTVPSGCARTATVNVAAALAANTGNDVICVGGTTTLANATPGGTWASSVPAKATVGLSTGIVTGASAGTSNITYKASGVGCTAITQVTVNAAIASITGTTNVCVSDNTTLSHAVPGGTWSSSNTGLATVDNMTGVVTGVAAGAPTITYTASPGCTKTAVVTVKALPTAIGGTLSVCAGSSTTLTSSPSGGTWTSSNTGVALMNLTTGAMVGVSAGTITVTYRGTNLCIRTAEGTVNALPPTIGGTLTASVTGTSTLTNATPGGTWTSSNITKATVDNMTGVVTGVAVGTSVISYTLPTGCVRAATFSVTASKPGGTVYFSNNDNKVIFSVFPNPTKGAFTIEAPTAGTFSVFTLDGKLVSEYKVNSQTTNVSLPADLAYGVYMCRFDQEDGESTIVRLWYQP